MNLPTESDDKKRPTNTQICTSFKNGQRNNKTHTTHRDAHNTSTTASTITITAPLNHGDPQQYTDDRICLINVPEQEMGPMQGGASGMPIGEEMFEEEYLAQQLKKNTVETADNIGTLRQVFSVEFQETNPSTRITEWPAPGAFVNDYSTTSLQIMTFPTLFPYG
jgi:hypothetical protein